jgi:hypothetical protein
MGLTLSRNRAAAIVAVLLGGIVAACGTTNVADTNTQFTKQVNLICFRTDNALGTSPRSITSLRAFGREIARDLPIYQRELNQLQSVNAPSAQRSDYSELLRAVGEQNDLLRKAVPPLLANDLKQARKFSSGIAPASAVVYKAELKLGLAVCSKAA